MEDFKENVNYIILAISPFIAYYIYYVITTELTPINFPPRTAKCPDYWVYDQSYNGCFGSAYPNYTGNISNYEYDVTTGNYIYDNTGKIVYTRNINDASYNFNIGDLSDNSINSFYEDSKNRRYINFDYSYPLLCDKYEWAKKHNITWSGISSLDKEHCIHRNNTEELDPSKDLLDNY